MSEFDSAKTSILAFDVLSAVTSIVDASMPPDSAS